jgi:hypothetical protein
MILSFLNLGPRTSTSCTHFFSFPGFQHEGFFSFEEGMPIEHSKSSKIVKKTFLMDDHIERIDFRFQALKTRKGLPLRRVDGSIFAVSKYV